MQTFPKELQALITVPGYLHVDLSLEVTFSEEVSNAKNLWLSDVSIVSNTVEVVALATLLTYSDPNVDGDKIHVLTQIYPRWTKVTSYITIRNGRPSIFTEYTKWKHIKTGNCYCLQGASIDSTTGKLIIQYAPVGLGSIYLTWAKDSEEFLSKFSIVTE